MKTIETTTIPPRRVGYYWVRWKGEEGFTIALRDMDADDPHCHTHPWDVIGSDMSRASGEFVEFSVEPISPPESLPHTLCNHV